MRRKRARRNRATRITRHYLAAFPGARIKGGRGQLWLCVQQTGLEKQGNSVWNEHAHDEQTSPITSAASSHRIVAQVVATTHHLALAPAVALDMDTAVNGSPAATTTSACEQDVGRMTRRAARALRDAEPMPSSTHDKLRRCPHVRPKQPNPPTSQLDGRLALNTAPRAITMTMVMAQRRA